VVEFDKIPLRVEGRTKDEAVDRALSALRTYSSTLIGTGPHDESPLLTRFAQFVRTCSDDELRSWLTL